MGKTRQTFSKEFKAKIALEALREESTIQQLSVTYSVHPKVSLRLLIERSLVNRQVCLPQTCVLYVRSSRTNPTGFEN